MPTVYHPNQAYKIIDSGVVVTRQRLRQLTGATTQDVGMLDFRLRNLKRQDYAKFFYLRVRAAGIGETADELPTCSGPSGHDSVPFSSAAPATAAQLPAVCRGSRPRGCRRINPWL